MLDQTFTTKNLRALLKKKDFIKYNLNKKDNAYLADIDKVANDINGELFFDSDFNYIVRNGKGAFDAGSLHNTLVLRKLNDNIKRLYKIKPSDRVNTIKQISCILEDMVPMWITKLDLTNFYETINRNNIITKLCTDGLLNYQSKKILKALLDKIDIKDKPGLPRGLSISSTLSELYMREFDLFVSKMDGVYFFARYVDDIIIFSFKDSKHIYDSIAEYVDSKLAMSLNCEKTMTLKANCRCTELCKCPDHGACKLICMCNKSPAGDICFDYLGYGFRLGTPGDKKKPGKPLIYISDNKVKKYKTRIILAFRDYIKTKHFALLENRIKFLTGNCLADPFDKSKELKTGIYYNYQLINDYSALAEMDTFYIKTLFSKKGSLGSKLNQCLSGLQKTRLKKYQFNSGYKNKVFHVFTGKELSHIQECWQI